MSQELICRAISEFRRIEFSRNGRKRSLDPYAVYSKMRSGPARVVGMDLSSAPPWTDILIDEISSVEITDKTFVPDLKHDPNVLYDHIICCIK